VGDETVGELLSELVVDQLSEERRLKDSLAQRSTVVLTGAGTVVSLALGGAAFITRAQSSGLPQASLVAILGALCLLILAAVAAVLVNVPWRQDALEIPAAQRSLAGDWQQTDEALSIEAYAVRLQLLADMRRSNRWRSRGLLTALALESVAFVALSVAVGAVILAPK
jgi:hypothetical protein